MSSIVDGLYSGIEYSTCVRMGMLEVVDGRMKQENVQSHIHVTHVTSLGVTAPERHDMIYVSTLSFGLSHKHVYACLRAWRLQAFKLHSIAVHVATQRAHPLLRKHYYTSCN